MARPPASSLSRGLLGALLTLLVANAVLTALATTRFYRHTADPGFLTSRRGERLIVTRVRPDSGANALRSGDEILALDGRGLVREFDASAFFAGRPPGAYRALVRRDGRLLPLRLEARAYGLGWSAVLGYGRLGVHVFFLLAGLAMFLLNPEGRAGVLLALVFALFIPTAYLPLLPGLVPTWARGVLLASETTAVFFWPALLHFLLVFPEPAALLRRFPRLAPLLYVPSAAILLPVAWVNALCLLDTPLAFGALQRAEAFNWVLGGLWMLYCVVGLGSLVVNYAQAAPAARRRIKVAVVGTLCGFLPLLLLVVASLLVDLNRLPLELLRGLALAVVLALPLVPLAFGYAIIKHQVIPVRVIVRRGLRYVLVSRGFILEEIALVTALVTFVLTGSRAAALDRIGPRADVLVTALATVGGVLALSTLHRKVRSTIDRRFFREAYNAHQLLASLSEAVREVPDADALFELVSSRVSDAVHPESIRIYIREPGTPRYALAHPARALAAPLPASVVERLRGSGSISLDSTTSAPGPEGAILALPIRGKSGLLGALVLGPRMGDLPYTREDRALLLSVASQAGLALENTQLIQRVAEQERVRHELSIAAEVQRRLFPDRPPKTARLDLFGVCVPAGDVGGDYYDFLEFDVPGHVGFAVADVAGKGLPAALLMSMAQASLRSRAVSPDVPLHEVASAMNRLFHRSTAPNAYTTFFCAIFAEADCGLRYVNAGHNPPLLLRAAASPVGVARARPASGGGLVTALELEPSAVATLTRLTATGLVLGAVMDSLYTEQAVRLEPGDVLVAYTDGVSEAFSPEGEEFGEERLAALVSSCRDLPARGIGERIQERVEAWRGGSPAHDDLTLVVAKVR